MHLGLLLRVTFCNHFLCLWFFMARVQCTTSAFGDDPCQMLKVVQHFCIHYSCHLQSEYVLIGHFWMPYIGQVVGSKWEIV
jgi:hypothetical protein